MAALHFYSEYDLWAENSQDITLLADHEDESITKNEIIKKRRLSYDPDNINQNKQDASNRPSIACVKTEKSAHSELTREQSLPKECDTIWSIEDDTLFYPLGIRNHCVAGVNKSVVIVWSEYSVINFVIKKNEKTKSTKCTRVRLDVPNGESIRDIQILELNTLLLLDSGRVNFFSSARSMHTILWLNGVRCITKTRNGFGVIRLLMPERKLLIEVYEDLANMGKRANGPLRHRYDITFDEQNLFNCNWENEHYNLVSVSVDENNIAFLKRLIRNDFPLEPNHEIYIFAVSGNIFVLLPDIKDDKIYQVEILYSFASNVQLIKLDYERKICFILLQCGLIEIWYWSNIRQCLRLQKHCTGDEFICFSYSKSRAALFFTDESQVVELKFTYVAETDNIKIMETIKSISGILVCTWVESIEQLVCLDCNNIFHQLTFDTDAVEKTVPLVHSLSQSQVTTTSTNLEKFNILFELTPQRVAQLLEKAHLFQELKDMPKVLHRKIEEEYSKQEILAIVEKRRYYGTMFSARLEYSCSRNMNLPREYSLLCSQTEFTFSRRSLIACIYLESKCEFDDLKNVSWQLHLNCDDSTHIFTVSSKFLKSKLCFVVPLEKQLEKLLPRFQLTLYTFVSHAQHNVAISIPIEITTDAESYRKLFTLETNSCLNSQNKLTDLLLHFNKRNETMLTTPEIECCVKVPGTFKLHDFFTIPTSAYDPNVLNVEDIIGDENKLQVCFFESRAFLDYDSSKNIVIIRSTDVTALFYIKLYLCTHESMILSNNFQNDSEEKQQFVNLQANVERFYGTLTGDGLLELETTSKTAQKLEILLKTYEKFRKELVHPSFK